MLGKLVTQAELPNGGAFLVVIGDLTSEPTDCIVNAANGWLGHGGGVAAAIANAAGPSLVEEGNRIVRERGPIPVGEAVVTTAGNLPLKGVIHAVGPRMGDGDEENKLVRALQAAFLTAQRRGWKSLSFPALGAGIYSIPLAICARGYVRAVREFFTAHPKSPLATVRLCVFNGPLVEMVKAEVSAAFPPRE
jgi:O-acetyl-ADP-ribose deacetylase (regulator of RNase III)